MGSLRGPMDGNARGEAGVLDDAVWKGATFALELSGWFPAG
jgi:hypothetical protein